MKEGPDRSLPQRWTPLIAAKGFAPLPTVFLENYSKLNITVSEAMLLVHIHQYKWTADLPFPSVTLLARLMGCSTRNVRKLCLSLESVGYIKRVTRDGMSNLFDMSGLYAKLEDIITNVSLANAAKKQEVEAALAAEQQEVEAALAAEQNVPPLELVL
ncbi:helix-turn-helix domain-containing protein [Corallococcus exercitus]|uniref:helix-turn-helix domain-containing protein n=1 Tax=Corallococcus exercitus TaxID=2316736 RepID=UPI003F6ADADF